MLFLPIAFGSINDVDLGMMMRFTESEGGAAMHDTWWTVSSSALLAAEHFNARNPMFVDEFSKLDESCPTLRMKPRMVDTASVPAATLRGYRILAALNVSAIIGPPRSVNAGIAGLAGSVDQIPIISHWATSPALSTDPSYPLFLRTIPSDKFSADVVLSYLSHLNFDKTTVLYEDDAWAVTLFSALSLAGANGAIDVHGYEFLAADETAIEKAISAVAKRNTTSLIVASFEASMPIIIKKLLSYGLAGPGRVLVFPEIFVVSDFLHNTDSDILRALTGSAILNTRGLKSTATGKKLHQGITERFSNQRHLHAVWKPEFDVPGYLKDVELFDIAGFAYDAVAAVGLSLCSNDTAPTNIRGADLYGRIKNQSFSAVSGDVIKFDETGSRDPKTATCFIMNVRGGTRVTFQDVAVYSGVSGFHYLDDFHFSNGRKCKDATCAPRDIQLKRNCVAKDWNITISSCDQANNRIASFRWREVDWADDLRRTCVGALPESSAIVCQWVNPTSMAGILVITLCATGSTIALTTLMLILWFRKTPIMKWSQPGLCYVLCLGGFLSCITPLCKIGNITAYSCTMHKWLFNIALTLFLASIVMKEYRLMKIFLNKNLKKVRVSELYGLQWCAIMVSVDLAVLLVYAVVEPNALVTKTQYVNVHVGSVKVEKCNDSRNAQSVSLILWLWKVSLVGNTALKAIKTRNVSDAVSESKVVMYIVASLVALGVMWLFLTVILSLPPASALVLESTMSSGGVSLSLLLLFVPKLLNVNKTKEDLFRDVTRPSVQSLKSGRSLNSSCESVDVVPVKPPPKILGPPIAPSTNVGI